MYWFRSFGRIYSKANAFILILILESNLRNLFQKINMKLTMSREGQLSLVMPINLYSELERRKYM